MAPGSDQALKGYLLAFWVTALNAELGAPLRGWVPLLLSRGKIFEMSHFLPSQQEVEVLITACLRQVPGAAKLRPTSDSRILIVWWFWHLATGEHICCSRPLAER